MIHNMVIGPGDVGPDNRIRLPATPHEKYSVIPGTGAPRGGLDAIAHTDGQTLLYADNHCYPSGDCYLKTQFVPANFVLSANATDYDLKYRSKGFEVWAKYSPVQLDEIEDKIEW